MVDPRHRASHSHRLYRGDADHGHVEPHVLVGFRHLHDSHARTGQVPSTADDFVGTFHGFHGDDGLVLDGDRLTDIQCRDRIGHAVAKREVLRLVLARPATRQHALARE